MKKIAILLTAMTVFLCVPAKSEVFELKKPPKEVTQSLNMDSVMNYVEELPQIVNDFEVILPQPEWSDSMRVVKVVNGVATVTSHFKPQVGSWIKHYSEVITVVALFIIGLWRRHSELKQLRKAGRLSD
jgi:hypothetical protein